METLIHLLTKLTDVIIGVGLRHGSDGEKWAAVPAEGFTQYVLSQVDLRCPQILQFGKVHLNAMKIVVFISVLRTPFFTFYIRFNPKSHLAFIGIFYFQKQMFKRAANTATATIP